MRLNVRSSRLHTEMLLCLFVSSGMLKMFDIPIGARHIVIEENETSPHIIGECVLHPFPTAETWDTATAELRNIFCGWDSVMRDQFLPKCFLLVLCLQERYSESRTLQSLWSILYWSFQGFFSFQVLHSIASRHQLALNVLLRTWDLRLEIHIQIKPPIPGVRPGWKLGYLTVSDWGLLSTRHTKRNK